MSQDTKNSVAPDNQSENLLKLVRGKSQPSDIQRHLERQNEHEEDIHIDERWLIAYADKMTILCGFFIMLYAMSDPNPVKMKQVVESANKTFAGTSSVETTAQIPLQEFEDIKNAKKQLEQKTEVLTEQTVDLQFKIKVLVAEIPKLKQENQTLNEQLKQTKRVIAEITPPPKPTPIFDPTPLKQENAQLKIEIQKLEKTLEKQAAPASNEMGFLAFVMSWPTQNHDIDLTVTDPSGKIFNFKSREFTGYPGLLVLDTRKGPGVEVWQADRIIEGIYQFTYTFYNDYGNSEPCPVLGTLFTPKNKIVLKSATMTLSKNKTQTFRIKIDNKGNAQEV